MERHQDNKGQTSVDFLTGMSIFALTIIFVLQFTGGSLVTVGSTSTEKGALADRTAAFLIENEWSGGEPGVVNESDAESYFSLPNDYSFWRTNLAIPDRYDFNITVRNTTGKTLQPPRTSTRLGTDAGAPNDESNVADIAEVGSKKRVAYMQGDDTNFTVVVEVKVW